MGVTLNSKLFVSEDLCSEVTALQNLVYDINAIRLDSSSSVQDWALWQEKRMQLDERIEFFNLHQKSKALRNSSVNETKQLLPMYLDMHSCIQASQKTSKGMDTNVFVTYRDRTIGFSDFFRSQHHLYDKYIQLRNSIISLSYCVFENINTPSDGNTLYGKYFTTGRVNPYSYSFSNTLINNRIKKAQTATISGVKSVLMQIFTALFSDDIAPITSRITRSFILCVSKGDSVESLIDAIFSEYEREEIGQPHNNCKINFDSSISRHVAWCTFRMEHKECILLKQPCHASVDCTFYRENSAKRKLY